MGQRSLKIKIDYDGGVPLATDKLVWFINICHLKETDN